MRPRRHRFLLFSSWPHLRHLAKKATKTSKAVDVSSLRRRMRRRPQTSSALGEECGEEEGRGVANEAMKETASSVAQPAATLDPCASRSSSFRLSSLLPLGSGSSREGSVIAVSSRVHTGQPAFSISSLRNFTPSVKDKRERLLLMPSTHSLWDMRSPPTPAAAAAPSAAPSIGNTSRPIPSFVLGGDEEIVQPELSAFLKLLPSWPSVSSLRVPRKAGAGRPLPPDDFCNPFTRLAA
ncbi:hypothetical protein B296_00001585 [Ensete ventricosum]|uniref:Uncharacterized protein n=1 Tax=Ensete ventricosum TaxID=4639 RepID=A0A427AWS9_ENSVE|nr:hypothetical protein B296_00001585 [Ensete ventricosum]